MRNIVDSVLQINRKFLVIHVVLFLILVSLQIYYIQFITQQFDYLGFKFNFSFIKFIEFHFIYLMTIILSFYLFGKSHFIFSILILIILFFLIPNGIMMIYSNAIRGPVYSILLFISTFCLIAPLRLKLISFSSQKSFINISIFGIFTLLILPIIWIYLTDFNFNTLLLKDIYQTRDAFSLKETALTKYFYNWLVKVIIPFMFVYFMLEKQRFLASIGLIFLIYLFVISGNKAVYFTSIITIFFYFFGKGIIDKLHYFMVALLISFPLISVGDYFLNDYLLRGTLIMRPFYFPALLNYCYFDYFKEIPLYFSENHLFNSIFVSPIETKSAILISKVYFHTDDMYANNGLISDGYMNLGYLGVFLLSIIFSIVFMLFNSLKVNPSYFGIFFILVVFFLSAPVFTVIVTGGVWILLFLMYITMKKNSHEL